MIANSTANSPTRIETRSRNRFSTVRSAWSACSVLSIASSISSFASAGSTNAPSWSEFRLRNELSRVHDAERVERLLDRPQRMDAPGRRQPRELGALQLADAMLGGNRPARRSDEVVDQPGDILALRLIPAGRGVASRADVEVDVAVAQMAEAGGDNAGEGGLHLGRGFEDEPRHITHSDRDIVRQRRSLGALGFGNRIAQFPESVGLRFVGREDGVADDPLLHRRGEQAFELRTDVEA